MRRHGAAIRGLAHRAGPNRLRRDGATPKERPARVERVIPRPRERPPPRRDHPWPGQQRDGQRKGLRRRLQVSWALSERAMAKARRARTGSGFLPAALFVARADRAQHAQQAFRHLLVQKLVAELAQRLVELRVAVGGHGPDHGFGLVVLGQRAVSRRCLGHVSVASDHMAAMVKPRRASCRNRLARIPWRAYDKAPSVDKFPIPPGSNLAVSRTTQLYRFR